MTGIDYRNKNNKLKLIDILFIVFCLFPFIIPNPVVVTNIQPYAALLGTFVILLEVLIRKNYRLKGHGTFFAVTWFTLGVAIVMMFLATITMASFRAIFNYYSVAIIPFALYLILMRVNVFPENLIKILILVWFAVATVQFFVDRGFMTQIIGGVRFSYSYRGVVGLASEPSFLGITCFYFLHMIMKFKKHRMLFFALVLVMGIVYAQSMMGVLFIAAFFLVFLLDATNSRSGIYIWIGAVFAVAIFWVLLNTVLVETRLYQLISVFSQEGVSGILDDASAGVRYNSLTDAIADSFSNYLLPMGYTRRIGSGYGGFLCELGFFALPALICISWGMSQTFKKKVSQVLYFVLITILLFNNTQIGNPLLLIVLTFNLYFPLTNGEQKRSEP